MDENKLHPAIAPFFIFLSVAVVLFFAPAAHAYTLPKFFDFGSLETIWTKTCGEDKNHGVIERFVLCTRMTVTNVFYYFIFYIYPAFESVIDAAITFCVILFGIKAMSGNMENVGRESFMLAIKIGFVIYFTSNLDMVFDTMIELMDSLLNLVTEFTRLSTKSPLAALKCDDTLGPVDFILTNFGLSQWPFWKRVDCILNGVIGLGQDPVSGRYDVRFSQGVMAFFIYCLASGLWGFFIFLMGFVMCTTLVLCALRAVQLYLLCFIMLAILSIMGVIFIPLILFKNETVNAMFKKWVVSGLGYMIQPVLMFAFMSLLMTAYDTIMFSGKTSVFYALAGEASKDKNFNLHQYLETNHVYTTNSAMFEYFLDPGEFNTQEPCKDGAVQQDSGVLGNALCLDGGASAAGASDAIRQGLAFKAIDWEILGNVRNPAMHKYLPDVKVNTQYTVAAAMIMAALAIYVFNMFLTFIPQIVGQIGGGADKLKGAREVSQAGFDLPGGGAASAAIGRVGSGIEAKLGFRP